MTVFKTHYNLFEWMITLFDLVNILSTFQKYINSVLKNYLNEFVSVYLNDILIFFSDSLKNHCQKMTTVLKWLWQTDLQIDIDKCEFKTTFTKYLEFIVEAEKDVSMNSDKIKVILKWEWSQSVKNVKFFLNFANFY